MRPLEPTGRMGCGSEVIADGKRDTQRIERRDRDSNPSYGFDPVKRFSKPSPSAARPSLRRTGKIIRGPAKGQDELAPPGGSAPPVNSAQLTGPKPKGPRLKQARARASPKLEVVRSFHARLSRTSTSRRRPKCLTLEFRPRPTNRS